MKKFDTRYASYKTKKGRLKFSPKVSESFHIISMNHSDDKSRLFK